MVRVVPIRGVKGESLDKAQLKNISFIRHF